MSGMNDSFWWNWWVNAAVAVATFAAVLVALFGQAFRGKFFPPKLSLRVLNQDGERTTVLLRWREGNEVKERSEDARYYHLRVMNSRRWSPAAHLQVVLLQVEEPGPNEKLQVTWSGAIPLGWRHQELFPPARTIGAPADVDLCSVVKDKWLQLHLLVRPFNLEVERRAATTLVLSLQAQANEGDSPVLRLKIAWNGKWDDGAQEMRRHLTIEPLDEMAT
jgi:hypothetical protein